MSKTVFYQKDFKPDYQLFQQKISQLSLQKSRITKKQVNLQRLQHQLELVKEQIEDQGLQYDQSSIFVRYASIQQLAQKKKTASDCCVHCGEQMKKPVQCELCAEVFCKNCCWRKRVIPFEQHQDFRLCCEQCHQKYIKHFNNQQFYKEKGVYLAAIDELGKKYEKAKIKCQKKEADVNQYKEQKRTAKIKQGNLKKAVMDEDKRIKQLTEEFEKAVKQKAERMKLEEDRMKREQMEEQQRKQRQQIQKQLEDQKRMLRMEEDQKKLVERAMIKEQELAKREAQIRREKEELQKAKKELSQSRAKQLQELQRKKSQEKEQKTVQKLPIDRKPNQQEKKNGITQKPKKQQPKAMPQQVISMQEIDFDSILNEEQPKIVAQQQRPQRPTLKDLLKQIKETKKVEEPNVSEEKPVQKTPQEPQKKSQKSQKKQQKSQNALSHQEPQEVNEAPRITMTQIKTMSINDLLSMKIPMNPSSAIKQKKPRKSSQPQIKVQAAQQNSTTTQNEKMYQSLLQPGYLPQENFMVGLAIPTDLNKNESSEKSQKLRNSVHSVREQQDDQMNNQQKENQKKALLRKESLISSVNKASVSSQQQRTPKYDQQEDNAVGEPQSCTCEIM